MTHYKLIKDFDNCKAHHFNPQYTNCLKLLFLNIEIHCQADPANLMPNTNLHFHSVSLTSVKISSTPDRHLNNINLLLFVVVNMNEKKYNTNKKRQ